MLNSKNIDIRGWILDLYLFYMNKIRERYLERIYTRIICKVLKYKGIWVLNICRKNIVKKWKWELHMDKATAGTVFGMASHDYG